MGIFAGMLEAFLKMRNCPSDGIFGGCRGGSSSASPQRAVLAEPTKTDAKRPEEIRFLIFRQTLTPRDG